MINEHPDIYLLPPLPLYEYLFPVVGLYGDLAKDQDWAQLVEDALALLAVNHHPLQYSLVFDEVMPRTAGRSRTLGTVCQACFDLLVEKSGKPIGGLKSGIQPDKIIPFLASTNFTHAVFQYRDPRDVCLSAYKAARYTVEPASFVKHWLLWHRTARSSSTSDARAYRGAAIRRYRI